MSTSTDPAVPAEPYRQPVDAVLAELGTEWHHGLGESDVRARLEQYGRNELAGEASVPAWR